MPETPQKKQSRRALLSILGASAMSGGILHEANGIAAYPLPDAEILVQPSVVSLTKLTKLKPGTIVSTLGYYHPGDGGNAIYEIRAAGDKANGVQLRADLFAVLLHSGNVNYKMFGAKCDGQSDDGVAIKAAHQYANEAGIPVLNFSGEFWIKETRSIPVRTSTNWGSSVFHLDESLNTPKETHFEVKPDEEPKEIRLSPDEKTRLVNLLKPGTKFIPELASYHNCLIVVKDENDRIGRRYGADYNPRGWAREEFFYVEEHGRIIGDIAWTFSDYTHLTAYPCGQNYLTIEGGTFLVSGDSPGKIGCSYHQGGITTRRSRTIIRNQWVGLEKNKQDIALTPRSGFYSFSHVYDILLENVRLIPWEKDREGKERDLAAGTYGIGGSRVLCGTFRNITAEGSPVHWGVFGTNLFKNFRIENCRLNRVDVHFHGWNITIKDSEIGQKGLTLTGGGELLIENTRVFNNIFLNFRADYGAKWDGPVKVLNSRAVLQDKSNAAVISMVPGKFDYRYPVVFGHQIIVRDFVFISQPEWEAARYQLVRFPDFSSSQEGGRIVFPKTMIFSQIEVQGRKKGIHLLELPHVGSFYIPDVKGGNKGGILLTNSSICFESIRLEEGIDSPNLRLGLTQKHEDEYSLFPQIAVTDCPYLNADLGDITGSITVRNSLIEQFLAGASYKGRILFDSCNFRGETPTGGGKNLFEIQSETGVVFNQCEINLPVTSNASPGVNRIDFMKINKLLKHNHTGTRLGSDFRSYLTEQKISLRKEFIAALKSHSELEGNSI